MSSPSSNPSNRNRGPRGSVSQRAIKNWRDGFNGHVHSAPDSNLPTVNLPANPNRNPFSLAKVRHLPSAQEMCNDAFCGCQASDGQLSQESLRNYAALVWTLAQKSDIQPALIEHDTTL